MASQEAVGSPKIAIARLMQCGLSTREGAIVPGLADRNGQRYSKAGIGKWGGKRMKNVEGVDMGWLDGGARDAMMEKQLGIVEI